MAPEGLKTNGQYRRVYLEGHREAGSKIIIYHLETDGGGIRAGFVASKKNVGNRASQRNRAKRLMREIFRKLKNRISADNLWIIFIASFKPEETTFQKLLEDVESSLERAGLIARGG
jgi:ribonuclease P protein component